MKIYSIGFPAWLVRDRNYPDVRVGEEARFALRFQPIGLEATAEPGIQAQALGFGAYRIRARVIYAKRRCWVIDFGLLAYHESEPLARKSQWVEGEIALSVDPFSYRDELHALQGMPELIHRFRIKNILRETTPWLSIDDGRGTTILMRDGAHRTFSPVSETDAWADGGNAHYVLECEQITGPRDRLPTGADLLNLNDGE